jgi:hypothetical protein
VIPSIPRKPFIASVSTGRPPRHCPTADSLSQTRARGTAPRPLIRAQCPASRSGDCRDGIIRAIITREYPATMTRTGGRPSWPEPRGTSAGGNHRSHWASSPGRYSVRDAGSGGTNNGRSSRTRTFSTVKDRDQPIRSAITVAGMSGHCASNSRIRGSAASAIDPFGGRTYLGGPSAASARRTVFRPIPSLRAIARTGIPSARCSRRISAQFSTLITPHYQGEGSLSAARTSTGFTRR